MIIRTGMIDAYLQYITMIELPEMGDVTEDMSVFDSAIDSMAADAVREGNLKWLQYALDSLASEPGGRVSDFFGDGFPFSEDELAAVLGYAFERICPTEAVSGPGAAVPVDFVAMSAEEWAGLAAAG